MVKPPRPEQPLFSQLDAIQVADRIVQLPDVSVYLFGNLTTVPASRDTFPVASDIDLIVAAPTTTCFMFLQSCRIASPLSLPDAVTRLGIISHLLSGLADELHGFHANWPRCPGYSSALDLYLLCERWYHPTMARALEQRLPVQPGFIQKKAAEALHYDQFTQRFCPIIRRPSPNARAEALAR